MRGKPAFDGAVQINFGIFIEPPKSWSKKKRADALGGVIYPTTKPDWDNIVKGVQDACNGIVFVDDKQIINSAMTKRYAENARVEVRVYEVSFDGWLVPKSDIWRGGEDRTATPWVGHRGSRVQTPQRADFLQRYGAVCE